MKAEVKTPVLVAVVAVVVVVALFFGYRSIANAGNLDQGQVQYTPGKPPWEETDPNKKGPGASPAGGGFGAPSQSEPAPNAPPGMGAPALGNGG